MTSTITITDAMLKAGNTFDIVAIPAQGAGKVAIPTLLTAYMKNYVQNYTNIGAGSFLLLRYPNGTNALASWDNSIGSPIDTLLAGGENTFGIMNGGGVTDGTDVYAGNFTPLLQAVNAPLTLRWNNGGAGAVTDGDASTEIIITITYTLLNIA